MEAQTALILGGLGQDGWFLSGQLAKRGFRVIVSGRHLAPPKGALPDNVSAYRQVDVAKRGQLRRVLEDESPTHVFNLAGFSHVGESWAAVQSSKEVNQEAVPVLIQEITRLQDILGRGVYVFHSSSSEIFGGTAEYPQTEQSPFRPVTPYGEHKARAHEYLREARDAFGVSVGIGILYNHESVRRPETFVSRRVTKGVARIVRGEQKALTLGNLDARRDWGYAGDYCEAIAEIASRRMDQDLIVASSVLRSVRDLVISAFEAAGVTEWKSRVDSDKSLLRKLDPKVLVGDTSLISGLLGWSPRVAFGSMIAHMVKHDLEKLGHEPRA